MRNPSTRAARITARTVQVAASALMLVALLVAGVRAGPETTDYRTTKYQQGAQPADQPVEPGASEAIDLFPSQPAAKTPPSGRTCPAAWLFFSNNVMRYDLCYPPTWGFNDGSSTQPMSSISGPSLYGVQLMSAEAFPWTIGSEPVLVAAARHAAFFHLDVYQPHVGLPKGCTPATPITVTAGTGKWCGEYMRNDNGNLVPDPAGQHYVAKFLISLPTDPLRPSVEVTTTGYELAVSVMTSRSGWSNLGKTILDMVATIRPL